MSDDAGARFQNLVEIMRTLRSPHGCAWDREQTTRSLRPYVLEETYEVLDALDREDDDALRTELGDYVFEAVFLAQICEDEGRFSITDSLSAVADKLIRRHPHVFEPDGTPLNDRTGASLQPSGVKEQWEEIKARERTTAGSKDTTVLGGVPRAMPSLVRAYELSTRAATVGFDWVKPEDVLDKIDEEARELREAVAQTGPKSLEAEEELGDLLFAVANLARKLGIEPESALRIANDKFQRRFDDVEKQVKGDGKQLRDLTLEQLEAHWVIAKTNTTTKGTKDTKGTKGTKEESR